MADKPTKVQYVLGGRCTGLTTTTVDPTVEAILTKLGAFDAYAPQGRLTVTLENYVQADATDTGATGK